ncbi:MAG: acetyl-CoA carboxylase biotin carboxylase subunit [Candidatus Bathyarchaeia archaeon]
MKIKRIFVANRGEIAVRIIRTCKEMGIETVVAVSEADKESMPARLADHVVCIGGPKPVDSYLRMDVMVHAAVHTKCDAVHPGYGFLSERAEFAELCERNGLLFIGPSPTNLKEMGDKIFAKDMARKCGIPVIPGSEGVVAFKDALKIAEQIGFPVVLKAAGGGGGRGIRVVNTPDDIASSLHVARAEAGTAFEDQRVYVEKYLENVRHIEVQILADHWGNVVQLGERDCSIQRRYQKIIEEAPAPFLPERVRHDIRQAALLLAKAIKYRSAGTVEFLYDRDTGLYYFMEMNTRIQVEHPVTEMVTGVDLVKEQIKIAAGLPLSFSASSIKIKGHAMECRISAESPSHGFLPVPGLITRWVPPSGPGIRIDTHCFDGYYVPPYYDSLIAKLIVHGRDRGDAVNKMIAALDSFVVEGVPTTIPFLKLLISSTEFANGDINTNWVEKVLHDSYREGEI